MATGEEERITQLEILLTHQQGFIDKLNQELLSANTELASLSKRVVVIEAALRDLLAEQRGLPPNERPPHY